MPALTYRMPPPLSGLFLAGLVVALGIGTVSSGCAKRAEQPGQGADATHVGRRSTQSIPTSAEPPRTKTVEEAWSAAAKDDTLEAYAAFAREYPGEMKEELRSRADACIISQVRKAQPSGKSRILKDQERIPVVIFGNGAEATAASGKLTFEQTILLSDPTDPLVLRGSSQDTVYVRGRGAIILEDKLVYIYQFSLP